MSNTGGVLTATAKSILFNNAILPSELGFYVDTITTDGVLLLKKEGLSIPVNEKFNYKIMCGDAGAFKSIIVKLNNLCPCDECGYEYGITIHSKFKMPGFDNSELTRRAQYYGGKLPSVECSNGYIVDANMLVMEEDIINQINSYVPMNTNAVMPAQNASRWYEITDTDISDASVLAITIDGVTTSITSVTATPTTLVEAINADGTLAGRVKAMYLTAPTSAYRFAIWSDTGVIFTVAATTEVTIEERSILVYSRDIDLSISLEVNNSVSTIRGINFAKITGTTGAGNYLFNFISSAGTTPKNYGSACAANSDFSFSNLSYQLVQTWYLTKNGTEIYGYSTNGSAYITYIGTTMRLLLMTPGGSWSYLTSEEVFKEFAFQPNNATLANVTWANQPLKDTLYCKLVINWEGEIADLVGANHMNSRRGSVSLYFPMINRCTDTFDAAHLNYDEVLSPDTNITEFMALVVAPR